MKKKSMHLLRKFDLKQSLSNALFWFVTLLYMETWMHLLFFRDASWLTYLFAVGFTAAAAMLISGLLTLLPGKANRIASIVIVSILALVFCTQIVYHAIFGTMYSVSQIGLGGAAIASFWKETLLTTVQNIHWILIMLLPIPVTVFLTRKCSGVFSGSGILGFVFSLMIALALQAAVYGCLRIGGTGYYTTYYFYHSSETTTDQAAERFGLLTTLRLELLGSEGRIDPDNSGDDDLGFDYPDPIPSMPSQTLPEETVDPENPDTPTEPTQPVVEYNTLEIDFDYLNSLTSDKQILELNNYVASLTGTKKNAYTGMLKDYNLITICAESFSVAAIREDLTPTLYKLSTEGIVFRNFYNSYPNTTTDGEYSFCLGLWPDTSRGKGASSFYASRNSYLPFALGNVFQEQAGLKAYGYHNYTGSYYGRDETHPNMGYQCKFANRGMKFSTNWPSSDLEMMEQSVGDYLYSGEQFHAYYMTFSGHYQYRRSVNPMASRNYDVVQHLDLSEEAKCYLSCNYELEKALTYLMEQLEAAGIADKTAIVLAGDHFPYGLTEKQYSELVGYKIDSFSKYKSSLIFWVGGLDEPIVVDDYVCNIDILPTILNLWGFQYDSRLLAGTDVFSDAQHIAVLRDQSFLTDEVWFNASTGKATWLVDSAALGEGYLDSLIKKVKNQFALSKNILNEAYYNFLFEKGNVSIEHDSWRPPATEEIPPELPPETEPIPTIPPETIPQPTEPVVTEPVTPTIPATPTEPTEPADSTEPTEPTEVTEPTEPTEPPVSDEPTETTAPTEPQPTEPHEPPSLVIPGGNG